MTVFSKTEQETGRESARRFESRISRSELAYWKAIPAGQQPDWGDEWLIGNVRADLAGLPPLVRWDEVQALRTVLARAAAGELHLVQAGDCAEDPAECVPDALDRKVALLARLADAMRLGTGKPVATVGRIAGQFAKPRSRPTERHGDIELPAFRGLLVNGPEPDADSRRPDPLRLLACYRAAQTATAHLRDTAAAASPDGPAVWTSHEALVLDYEVPLTRRDGHGRLLLTSTHWPWIGERTRDPYQAHVSLLAAVSNPVACKVGPTISADELLALCARLDPEREPGRLTLIARIGANLTAERLPRLVAAVRSAGHPVLWMCDPMHANTETTADGRKTRLLRTVLREVRDFRAAVTAEGGVAAGLHLETTPDPVTECVTDESEYARVGENGYTTLCDPRLNADQALAVAAAWGR
ncbi:3-deoxy-7-phosphoheptulonate synthase [Streptomyces sp. NPDC002888]|uniref:3-deoxy-7-phosphoheptulonate synthase n=1 Tax=Streptomyces sp. NPDC002888 TaxID=3364668 RepID=UPI0036CF7BE6